MMKKKKEKAYTTTLHINVYKLQIIPEIFCIIYFIPVMWVELI